MKLNKYIIGLLIGISGSLFTSCSDFLDELPDNRAELTTPKSVKKLLVNGYCDYNYALIAELSGDNIIDNNSPNYDVEEDEAGWGNRYNLSAYERMDNEIFAWEEVKSGNDQDSPYKVWEGCYKAIAVANSALEAISKMRNEGGWSASDLDMLNGAEAEALLIRSYHHFLLVNIFSPAYRDKELSSDLQTALGIPYVVKNEDKVHVNYERLSVAEVYDKIGEDLESALELLNNGAQISSDENTQKYHFSKQSANAFAARYYLFIRDYEKVVTHATIALGDDPSSQMRDWMKFEGMINSDAVALEFASISSPSVYMFMSTYSHTLYHFLGASRYQCNRNAAAGTFNGFGPTWSVAPQAIFRLSGYSTPDYKQEYGVVPFKTYPIMEFTDKASNTGYTHTVRREFTAEETLLCRAEAYIYLSASNPEYLNSALADLAIWDSSRQNVPESMKTEYGYPKTLTDENIRTFYKSNDIYVKELHTEELSPSFILPTSAMPYIHCVLHFRRIETLFDGLRWFDIKRYGIEVVHAIGKDKVDTLKWNDPRRAIQIPQEVISAGMQPNIR